ncbi:hypothetical protein F0L17_10795 [Streptomyces sp. TRM43335]|uniref:Cation/H+ exchanger transmembrane domain-containing protein n=1 Tax=Streptomyces taklimakanensis TaxID=2569853 RepID=A0A6G2BBG3_9ACTN|nr:cation:proton antiporter [Streptomyces taklimakanensis]MTE19607.1 hypothetical protein [Streptomyces taklimakanensis]
MARLSSAPARRHLRFWSAATLALFLPVVSLGLIAAHTTGSRTAASDAAPPHEGMGAAGHFLLAAAAVLAAAHLGGVLVRRLGQPRVVGEICAGLLLGPSLLGRAAPDAAGWLFPERVLPMLDGLAQLGLALFVFGVGRELSGTRLRGAAGQALLISQASLLIPFAAGAAVAVALVDDHLGPGGRPLTFVLFIGCTLSVTAFPVLARILADLGITRTRTGQLGLYSAAVGDAGSWLLLAAILAASHGFGASRLLLDIALLVAVAVLFLGPLRLLLARWADRADGRRGAEVGTAVLLTVCVTASAALTAALGVHQLIGALLAGVAWPTRGRWAVAVAERLADTAKTVLLPFFFFGFGLTTDLGALAWGGEAALTFGCLLAVAVASKVLGPGLCARLTGMSWPSALALGVLLNARGLTELVVIQIGYQARIIDAEMASVLTLVALVTTAVTSPLLRLLGPGALDDRPLPRRPPPPGAGEDPGAPAKPAGSRHSADSVGTGA